MGQQDDYTKHRTVRKRFVCIPHTVSNPMDVREFVLLDVQALAKHNDMHRYILSVIEDFSKYLHLVQINTKSGPSFTSVVRYMNKRI